MVGTSLQFTVPETNLLLQAALGIRVGLVGWKQARCHCRVGGSVGQTQTGLGWSLGTHLCDAGLEMCSAQHSCRVGSVGSAGGTRVTQVSGLQGECGVQVLS